jgi:hypothetical protein
MTIEQIIIKAQEGGYVKGNAYLQKDFIGEWINVETKKVLLLDPLFWQSLGKALNWTSVSICSNCGTGNNDQTSSLIKQCIYCGCEMSGLVRCQEEWRWQWHQLIENLANGKTPQSFFETLQ